MVDGQNRNRPPRDPNVECGFLGPLKPRHPKKPQPGPLPSKEKKPRKDRRGMRRWFESMKG
jgi:hypothetical protein